MYLFKGAASYTANGYKKGDVLIEGVTISKIPTVFSPSDDCTVIDASDLLIIPGFVDVHVHLREPGFFYKETVATGTASAASAGYTALFSMPNLNPVPDSVKNIKKQLDIIEKTAKIKVYPYAAITVDEKGEQLSDMEGLAEYAIAFSDDGRGVQSEDLMLEAMKRAKALNKKIVAHCEDLSLIDGGFVHDGDYAKLHSLKGISSESEWKQVERDLKLVERTGVEYHICHVSTKESVALIREAKQKGLPVTAETAPHYLLLTDMDITEDSGRFKMNPPLRGEADRDALIEGLNDGTIDIIATDHAPHSLEEKSKGLEKSLMGVIGLEAAFGMLYNGLVKTGKISLPKILEAMCYNPRKIFGLPLVDPGEAGSRADLAVIDLSIEWTVRGDEGLSKGNSTPFEGMTAQGKNVYTLLDGELIWKNQKEN